MKHANALNRETSDGYFPSKTGLSYVCQELRMFTGSDVSILTGRHILWDKLLNKENYAFRIDNGGGGQGVAKN